MKYLFILILFLGGNSMAQQIDSIYRIESKPTYDENGNLYTAAKDYDHLPDAADSAEFLIYSESAISEMIRKNRIKDSLEELQYRKNLYRKPSSRPSNKKKHN